MGRRLEQVLLQTRHADGQQVHEMCLTLLIIREMQIFLVPQCYG